MMHELAYNLESFNPAFTAVLLKVQSTIGLTDYVRRDQVLSGGGSGGAEPWEQQQRMGFQGSSC